MSQFLAWIDIKEISIRSPMNSYVRVAKTLTGYAMNRVWTTNVEFHLLTLRMFEKLNPSKFVRFSPRLSFQFNHQI